MKMTWGLYIRALAAYFGMVALGDFLQAVPPPVEIAVLACALYTVGAILYLFRYLFQHRDEIEGHAPPK